MKFACCSQLGCWRLGKPCTHDGPGLRNTRKSVVAMHTPANNRLEDKQRPGHAHWSRSPRPSHLSRWVRWKIHYTTNDLKAGPGRKSFTTIGACSKISSALC